MRKLVLTALSILMLASLLLAGCAAPAATPTPETIIQTVEVTKEVPVIETVEVITTQEVLVTPEPEVSFDRSETLYMGGTQWGPPTGFNPGTSATTPWGPSGCATSRCSFTTR